MNKLQRDWFTVITFARISTKRFFRDKTAIFFTIGFPLIFLFVFGGLNSNDTSISFNVALINQSDSSFSKEFVKNLKDSGVVKVSDEVTNLDVAKEKIKKKDNEGDFSLQLTKTKDILASLGEIKKDQFLVGFALETQNEEENAKLKLKKKNLDLIVLNSLRDKGAGFKTDTNKITLISKDNKVIPFPVKPKKEVAKDILNFICN